MAAVPGFSELPDLTAYLVCLKTTCTTAQLEQNAESDATSRGPGTYQYLLGNVATGALTLVQVKYILEKLCDYGCNTYFKKITLFQQIASSDYVNQFGNYVTYAGEGPPVIHVPAARVPGFSNDIGWEADTSDYLRGLPEFSNIFMASQIFEVEVIFADGTSALFISDPGMYNDGAFAFTYVAGSAKDANGNPIPDTGLGGPPLALAGAGVFAGWNGAAQNGGFLILPNVPVYYDTDLVPSNGIETIGILCDSNGNCSTQTQ